MRNLEQAGKKLGRRNHVTRGPLHRFHQYCGNASCRILLDHLADEIETKDTAPRIGHVKGAAITVGIGREVQTGMKRAPLLLEWIADETKHAPGLAMKPSPETEHLKALRVRFRQADSRL